MIDNKQGGAGTKRGFEENRLPNENGDDHMRKTLTFMLTLVFLAFLGVSALRNASADGPYLPGLDRDKAGSPNVKLQSASGLAADRGVELADGMPLYVPKDPQPLNAILVTDPDCEFSWKNAMRRVSKEGIKPEFRTWLDQWRTELSEASGRAIRFVADPDRADIIISVRQSYHYAGDYVSRSGKTKSAGYACRLMFRARRLTGPGEISFSIENRPGETVSAPAGDMFWMGAPELGDAPETLGFVSAIMSWYGGFAREEFAAPGLAEFQNELIRRGFLGGAASGVFDNTTKSALKDLAAAYELPSDGINDIDSELLTAAYYNKTARGKEFIYLEKETMPVPGEPVELSLAGPGDTVRLGRFEQNGDPAGAPEALDWLVLAREENKLFVISFNIIEYMTFDEALSCYTWDGCSLRAWLNGEFVERAFTEEEKAIILLSDVPADANPKKYADAPGGATVDQVFLLSVSEAEKYFDSGTARDCALTEYAASHKNPLAQPAWWLRTAGKTGKTAYVTNMGGIRYEGMTIGTGVPLGVRPAMWIRAE